MRKKANKYDDILVSVIMSTKGTPKDMLKLSIESILNQTFQNFEFIIISDGCEENFKIIRSYKDKRIKLIKHDISKGLPFSLNEAMNYSRGKYIARMDSDDISLHNRLYEQVKFMEENDKIDICATLTKMIGDESGLNINSLFQNNEGIKAELFLYNCIVHPTVMFRKSFVEKNNVLYDTDYKYSQDYELWTRCCQICNITIIPKVCLKYRIHSKQISFDKQDEQDEFCKRILSRNLKILNIKNSIENLEIMLYLCHKSKKKTNDTSVLEFILKVLEANKKIKIYNVRYLEEILYHNYCITKIKQYREIPNISYMFKGRFFRIQIRKALMKIKLSII